MALSWQTPAGNLGTIPEDIFYSQILAASSTAYANPAQVTSTSSINNRIICDTTVDAVPGRVVIFFGTTFGGIQENTAYFVLSKISDTEFTISAEPDNPNPVVVSNATGVMTAVFYPRVYYRLQSGNPPSGVQISLSGIISGTPQAIAQVQGVPTAVSQDVVSRFAIRAYTLVEGTNTVQEIADRTFTLTVTGNDVPVFLTPAGTVGSFYDGDVISVQIQYQESDPNETAVVRLVSGQLPLGTTISETGLISGVIRPFPNEDEPVGYDLTPNSTVPYDFISSAISKNYQFTLEVTDGKSNSLRTFRIFVYNRADLRGDDTFISADNSFVTADQGAERAPFLLNATPSNIGTIRGDNYFSYRFIGQDYDTELVEYSISVNEGFGLPPGLTLDPYSGWYYGYVPDVGTTETTYSFFVTVRARSVLVTATEAGTNLITCDSTNRPDFYVGTSIVFEGTSFGGITPGETYYVAEIVDDTHFRMSVNSNGVPVFAVTDDTGSMFCVPNDIPQSQQYPFTLSVTGGLDREVDWLTDTDLGSISNGETSLLQIEAVNRGGLPLFYQLTSGDFNELPQGLRLLPTGEIAGRVTFNTFSIDQGATTFDKNTFFGLDETTFDSTYLFSVNAYAEDDEILLYKVSAVRIVNPGRLYTSAPSLVFDAPVGATAVRATASVTVLDGRITAVDVTNPGAEYTSVPGFTLTGVGFDAELEVIMEVTGFRRVVSQNKSFSLRVSRNYNRPYHNLYIIAQPPQNDRNLLNDLFANQDIFNNDYIYRPTDPNFGISKDIKYVHALGLAPETIDTFIDAMQLNHYWKNLILGEIKTAQATDSEGNVIYEVVYSQIVDDLVNNDNQSVGKAVSLPYTIIDPKDGSTALNTVYPNSLANMRQQMEEYVGRTAVSLPLWMTSKQENGRILGFTPAWVLCYTQPGRSKQVAYYINRNFGQRLNLVDFQTDRYVLDSLLLKNWDAATQQWTPTPSLTTFDRINTSGFTDLGIVQSATELAFADVQFRQIDYINSLGGLDGPTWLRQPGQVPPINTQVTIYDGALIVFAKQEDFTTYTIDDAFYNNLEPFDNVEFDSASEILTSGSYDFGPLIPRGSRTFCTNTAAGTNWITCESTLGWVVGRKVWFTGSTFGNIEDRTGSGYTLPYYLKNIRSINCVASDALTDRLTLDSTSLLSVNDEIWLSSSIGGLDAVDGSGQAIAYYVTDIPSATQIQVSTSIGGLPIPLENETKTVSVYLTQFSVSEDADLSTTFELSDASGVMVANNGYLRMGIYRVNVLPGDFIFLTLEVETILADFVTVQQGRKYGPGSLLYFPQEPVENLTQINWAPLLAATQVVSTETTFDENSLQFVEPVDDFDPAIAQDLDEYDKYLVFPQQNILI